MPQTPPVVLTIAGFDPSSGAGATADIKTIAAHGCYGVATLTALTVQSTSGVKRTQPIDIALLRETLEDLNQDSKISAVHIGMLGTAAVASAVADFLQSAQLTCVVLDTIIRSSSGATLLDNDAVTVLADQLLPLATVVTPNAQEAAVLTGVEVDSVEEMKQAAQQLKEMGAKAIVVTGGHLSPTVDVLLSANGDLQTFKSEKLDTNYTHGTGCAFSTSIACNLAQGRSLPEAVLLAKSFLTAAIANGYPVGKGVNPVNHMYRMRNHPGGFAKRMSSGKD
ncbi:MAG TPA: bifunctional hydroxymethylpyrimidine kinase/phosphomethylpyrimidine kinase [Terriglobales bacterium]|nr:bifunctional hydroxymethylpyrimidine kinase/phosphomethylpyrimidine kinase [Terriglobales bacterium]